MKRVLGVRQRIAIVTPSVGGGGAGGGERFPVELARSLQGRGLAVDVICWGGADRPVADLAGLNIVILKGVGDPFNPLPCIPSFLRSLNAYDLIHAHQVNTWSTHTALLARRTRMLRARVVVTDHGGGGRTTEKVFPAIGFADGVAAVSATSMMLSFRRSRNVSLVWTGVNPAIFHPALRDQLLRDYAVFVGRLIPYKGLLPLLRVWPPERRLVAVGEPVDACYLDECKQVIQSRHLKVEFSGRLDTGAVADVIRAAKLVVHPARLHDETGRRISFGELFPSVLLEGVACGVPFVSTPTGGPTEIAGLTGCGRIALSEHPKDVVAKVIDVWNDDAFCRTVHRQGPAIVAREYSWEAVADRCIAVYQRTQR